MRVKLIKTNELGTVLSSVEDKNGDTVYFIEICDYATGDYAIKTAKYNEIEEV